jgi:alpha-tubulin N-acetyltransferase 1
VITSCAKLAQPQSQSQRLYIVTDAPDEQGVVRALGFIKVGPVGLYLYDEAGAVQRLEPLCVLDFYVHESRQRGGIGRRLFEAMLAAERAEPHRLGFDRPSHKFLSFLHRHYGLVKYTPQVNGFVVFKQYFAPRTPTCLHSP